MKKLKILTLSFCSLLLINCVCYAKELGNINFSKNEENVELNSNFNEENCSNTNKKFLNKKKINKELNKEETLCENLKNIFSKKNKNEKNKTKNLKYRNIEKIFNEVLDKYSKNFTLDEPESENKKYAIIKTNGFEKFKSALFIIKNIKKCNLLNIKNNIKKLDKIFSNFIYFYECSNKKELLKLMKIQKIKPESVETVLNFNESSKFVEYYEQFKNEIKTIKKILNNTKTYSEKEEENKKIEDCLSNIQARFFKFAKELNVLIKKTKKSNFWFV